MKMRILTILMLLLAAVMVLVSTGCKTLNSGTKGPKVTVAVPTGMAGGADAVWTANWTGGTAPFSVSWSFSGGANPDTDTAGSITTRTHTTTVNMINASAVDDLVYNPGYSVTVTDSTGASGTARGSYTVGPMANQAPVIDDATYNNGILTVQVSDPDDGETLTVTVTDVAGMSVDATSKVASATGPFTATFQFTPNDVFSPINSTTTVEVSDGTSSDTDDVAIVVDPFIPLADTLFAVPLATETMVSAPDTTDNKVTVVVAQGTPANAFQYMNGCGIVVRGQWDDTTTPAEFDPDAGAYYVRGSFDVGSVDETADAGTVTPVDGIWASMSPGSFLLAPDSFIQGTNIDADNVRIDFNITPIGGSDLTGANAAGVLFNFKLGFGDTGTFDITMQQFSGVNRTFYSDSTSTVYYWGDITNDHSGVAHSVTVT